MPEVVSTVETVTRVLAVAVVPLLAIAVALSFVRRERRGGRPSFVVMGCALFVVAVAAVGVAAGQRAGIPWAVPWSSVAAFVLVGLLLRRDERFWAGLSALVVAYGLVGWVSVLGFSHAYDAETGGWRGVRLLVAWAGPEANPQAPSFSLAVVYLSIVRYGLPLAATVAVAWVLATRREMSRLERLSLILVSGTFLAEVVVGATLSAITFAVGLVAGLPLGLGLVGLLASLLTLVTVGPGAVTGIVVGVRWLATVRDVDAARSLVTTLRDVGGAAGPGDDVHGGAQPVSNSLVGFLRGNVSFVQRLNIVVIVLVFVVVGGLTFSFRVFMGDPHRVEVAYQYVESEQPIEGRALREIDGAQQTLWVLTRDQRLLHFDPAAATLTSVDLPVLDAFQLGDRVVTLTAEATPRVVLVGGMVGGAPAKLTPVVALAPGSRPTLAVVGTTAYVAEPGGRLLAVSSSGKVVRQTKVEPLTAVLGEPAVSGRPGILWTLHEGRTEEGASYRAIRRDPKTLAATGQEAVTGTELLRWRSGLTYDTATEAFGPRPGVLPGRWSAGPLGRLDLYAAGQRTRYDFHYDAVVGVRETSLGTWLVVDDHTGLALTPRAEPTSYLVRWPGAPRPPATSAPATGPATKPATKPEATPKPTSKATATP